MDCEWTRWEDEDDFEDAALEVDSAVFDRGFSTKYVAMRQRDARQCSCTDVDVSLKEYPYLFRWRMHYGFRRVDGHSVSAISLVRWDLSYRTWI
jgi:hypothetical protein